MGPFGHGQAILTTGFPASRLSPALGLVIVWHQRREHTREDHRLYLVARTSTTVESMSPHIGVVSSVLLAVGLLSGCSASTEAQSPVPVFQVQLGYYTITPAELTLPAGKFELVVTNTDPQLAHSLVLLKRGTRVLAPGESQTLRVLDGQEPTVGDYVMFCDVPGHRQAGQTGVVHVVAEASAP